MSGVITAVVGGAVIGGVMQDKASDKAVAATDRATEAQVGAQREQLEYLKEREALPQFYREGALQQLGSLYGLGAPPPPVSDEALGSGERIPSGSPALGKAAFVQDLMNDPFYQHLVSQGEESVLRGASATGGLRSGTASENLADVNMRALMDVYGEQVGGLRGLSGLPSGAPQIASVMGDIGATQAGGILGVGQIEQDKYQSYGNIFGQLGQGLTGVL